MQTLIANKSDISTDNLVEFIELLATIETTPEKMAVNSISMVSPDGTVITY
jgi:hypothetical protein